MRVVSVHQLCPHSSVLALYIWTGTFRDSAMKAWTGLVMFIVSLFFIMYLFPWHLRVINSKDSEIRQQIPESALE